MQVLQVCCTTKAPWADKNRSHQLACGMGRRHREESYSRTMCKTSAASGGHFVLHVLPASMQGKEHSFPSYRLLFCSYAPLRRRAHSCPLCPGYGLRPAWAPQCTAWFDKTQAPVRLQYERKLGPGEAIEAIGASLGLPNGDLDRPKMLVSRPGMRTVPVLDIWFGGFFSDRRIMTCRVHYWIF